MTCLHSVASLVATVLEGAGPEPTLTDGVASEARFVKVFVAGGKTSW